MEALRRSCPELPAGCSLLHHQVRLTGSPAAQQLSHAICPVALDAAISARAQHALQQSSCLPCIPFADIGKASIPKELFGLYWCKRMLAAAPAVTTGSMTGTQSGLPPCTPGRPESSSRAPGGNAIEAGTMGGFAAGVVGTHVGRGAPSEYARCVGALGGNGVARVLHWCQQTFCTAAHMILAGWKGHSMVKCMEYLQVGTA